MDAYQDTLLDIYSSYEELRKTAISCRRCGLCETRKNVVFCDGELNAEVMVVGEAPGASEDEQGKPFVGRSGQLLVRLFEQVGIVREDLYIANVIKCRPPENRNPTSFEIQQCRGYLEQQMKFLKPKVIVPVGNFASKFVLQTKEGITKIRGQVFNMESFVVIPTVHPAFVLRNGKKSELTMLSDLQKVKEILDLKVETNV